MERGLARAVRGEERTGIPEDLRVTREFKKVFAETLQAVIPVIVLVIVLQFTLLSLPFVIIARFLVGAAMVMAGLLLFLQGVKTGLLPIGEAIGSELPKRVSLGILLLLAFILGFVVTVAEPDVRVLAHQVDLVSAGEIGKGILVLVVALEVLVALIPLTLFFGFFQVFFCAFPADPWRIWPRGSCSRSSV
jgi:hypothetical protein